MTLNFQFVLFWLAMLAAGLSLGYLFLRSVLGRQAAQKNLAYAAPWIVLGGLAALLFPLLGAYGLIALLGIYILVVAIWLISWPTRLKGAGALKLSVGRTAQNEALHWVSLVTTAGAIALTLLLLDQLTGPLSTTIGIISGLVQILFFWTIPLFFFLLSRTHLEIREHGLAYLFAWQPWERIVAFGWDDDQPSTLLFKLVPRSPISRRYITMTIPAMQVEAVDKILERFLIEDEDLDDEIDNEMDNNLD